MKKLKTELKIMILLVLVSFVFGGFVFANPLFFENKESINFKKEGYV